MDPGRPEDPGEGWRAAVNAVWDTIRIRTRAGESAAVRPAEAEERRQRITEPFRRKYGSWRWNGPDPPGTMPPFKEIFTSWDGHVWVVTRDELDVPRIVRFRLWIG